MEFRMTREDVAGGVFVGGILGGLAALFAVLGPPRWGPGLWHTRDVAMPTVHVVCTADDVILWEGDAARADYADGQWTVCATSAPCSSTATRVRTSAACVVTPLVEAEP